MEFVVDDVIDVVAVLDVDAAITVAVLAIVVVVVDDYDVPAIVDVETHFAIISVVVVAVYVAVVFVDIAASG